MAFTVDIKGNASHLDKTLKNVKTSLGSIGSVAGSVTTALAGMGAAGAAAIGALVITSSKSAASMESLMLQFEVLTGSVDKAKGLIKTFRDEAAKSPLNTKDYADAARGFMSYGMNAEKVLPVLKMLGDVSMGNSERFGLLSYAMAQVASNTTLKGDDLRQLVEQGFNPLAIISEKTGRSMQDLRKDMEASKITFGMVEEALKSVTSEGGRFFGAIEKGAGSTEGKIAKLRDSALSLQVAFGTGFNEGLKDALDASSNFLPKLEAIFTEAGEIVGSAISDAVAGDYERFALIGGVIGEAVVAGFKAVWFKGVDELFLDQFRNMKIEDQIPIARILPNDALNEINNTLRGRTTDLIGENPAGLAEYIQTSLQESEAPKLLQQLQELNRTGKSQIEKLEKLKQFQNAKFTN